jgi:hypothetical protein
MAVTAYVATDQTGAQTQIDIDHASSWVLNVQTTFDLGGGLFTMKDGQTTADDITFSLYQGSDSTGTLLDSVTLTHAAFCSQVSNCGNFEFHQFFFVTPIQLDSGNTYFATLTSSAPDTQSLAYFIKSDTFYASDETGTPVDSSPFDSVADPAVPEPASFFLAGGGLLLLGASRSVLARLRSHR